MVLYFLIASFTYATRYDIDIYKLLCVGKGLPDVHSVINQFKDAFDWAEADQSGRIVPHQGVDADYDSACRTISDIESSLARYLKEQRKALGDASVRVSFRIGSFHAVSSFLLMFPHLTVSIDQLCNCWQGAIFIASSRGFRRENSSRLRATFLQEGWWLEKDV